PSRPSSRPADRAPRRARPPARRLASSPPGRLVAWPACRRAHRPPGPPVAGLTVRLARPRPLPRPAPPVPGPLALRPGHRRPVSAARLEPLLRVRLDFWSDLLAETTKSRTLRAQPTRRSGQGGAVGRGEGVGGTGLGARASRVRPDFWSLLLAEAAKSRSLRA